MKFRTDFVTNSSDSSFLTFNVKNKRLFDVLTNLGIKFHNVPDGEFSEKMTMELPSGETEEIDGVNNWDYPYFDRCNSISAWVVSLLLHEIETCIPPKREDEYSDFTKEVIGLLNAADMTHLDWETVDAWSREGMLADLEKAFDEMDGDMTSAEIEHVYGFEGEVEHCLYTEIRDGNRKTINIDPEAFFGGFDDDDTDTYELMDELWELTWSGGVRKFAQKYAQPVEMQVWKDGKWVSKA